MWQTLKCLFGAHQWKAEFSFPNMKGSYMIVDKCQHCNAERLRTSRFRPPIETENGTWQ